MNNAYLLIGGNLGDVARTFDEARALISRECGSITSKSALYKTAPWGFTGQNHFLNQVLVVHTPLEGAELMQKILAIEKSLGRARGEKYGPRIVDIDILMIDDMIINEPDLQVPHPQLPNRRFALEPLAELCPNLFHPVMHKTIHQLLLDCSDLLDVERLDDEQQLATDEV